MYPKFERSPVYRIPEEPSGERGFEKAYADTVSRLARAYIYASPGQESPQPNMPTIAERVKANIFSARGNSDLETVERGHHGLERLDLLIDAIESHERANRIHGGAWQEALKSRAGERGIEPETLTRKDVAGAYSDFPLKEALENAERIALAKYEALLDLCTDSTVVALNERITIERSDIEVLANDLRVRIAEREQADDERAAVLTGLNRELAEIIAGLPEEDRGKRFELEEVYLLRRLIQNADNGHLVSVDHGTPRQDLNPERGSVDLEIAAAGDVLSFQIKTLKRGVHRAKREERSARVEASRRKLEGTETIFATLEAEDVEYAFERASERQAAGLKTSQADKFEALNPLTHELGVGERHRLLTLLGLTEGDLAREQEEFERKMTERRAIEAELSERREREARAEVEMEERARQRELAEREERESAARQEADARLGSELRSRADALAAQAERESVEKKKRETQTKKQAGRQAEREETRKRLAEVEAERAHAEQKEREKEERRLNRERAKERAKEEWPPKKFTLLANVPVLKRIGLLMEDWNGNPPTALLEAKRAFAALFTDRTKKAERPNDLFMAAFPTKQSFESPEEDDVERARTLVRARLDGSETETQRTSGKKSAA